MEIQPSDSNKNAVDEITYRCEVIESRAVKDNKKIAVLQQMIPEITKTGNTLKMEVDAAQLSWDKIRQESGELEARADPASRRAPERLWEMVAQQQKVNAAIRADIAATRKRILDHSNMMAKRMHEIRKRFEDFAKENTEEALQRRLDYATEKLARLRQENLRERESNERLLARLLNPARLTPPAQPYTEQQLLDIIGLEEVDAVLKELLEREKVERARLQATKPAAEDDGAGASWEH